MYKLNEIFVPLNEKFYDLVVEEWKRNKCGARKLYAVLKRKGFSVSRRKIEQVLMIGMLTNYGTIQVLQVLDRFI